MRNYSSHAVLLVTLLSGSNVIAEEITQSESNAIIESAESNKTDALMLSTNDSPVDDNSSKSSTDAAREAVMQDASSAVKDVTITRDKNRMKSIDEVGITMENLVDALIAKGVLSSGEASILVTKAAQQAAAKRTAEQAAGAPGEKVIRVPYVPEFVKDDIRSQVRADLRTDVVQDVLTQATQERWGIPGVLPDWISNIKLKGDFRIRGQADLLDNNNATGLYLDYKKENAAGLAGKTNVETLNTTEDRQRMRERLRLSVDGKVSNEVKVGMRLSTGNTSDPVSTNQTIGTMGNRYQVVWDQAYLKYNGLNADRYNWITVLAGKAPNPWLSTDLVWDSDLAFDGVSATFNYNFSFGSDLYSMYDQNKTLYATVGIYPLQEIERYRDDKWLFGGQLGAQWIMDNQSTLDFGFAYYEYQGITGEADRVAENQLDLMVPTFYQKGNTFYRVADINDVNKYAYALASEYKLADITARFDLAVFSPLHAVLTLDYVKNIAYDKQDIIARTGDQSFSELSDKADAYQVSLAFGWPIVSERGNWRVTMAYKYINPDAVLDAFTDSDFHLGGTDAKGYTLSGEYGLTENTWMAIKWLSADTVFGAPFSIDVLQVDLNAKF